MNKHLILYTATWIASLILFWFSCPYIRDTFNPSNLSEVQIFSCLFLFSLVVYGTLFLTELLGKCELNSEKKT